MTDTIICSIATNCFLCQNSCGKCKSICSTCKYPCRRCFSNNQCKSTSTDTDDFDKYLDSQSRKIKVQPKVKTIGVDTCDLDGHFDYYKQEKKVIRIQKNVATDCADLNARQLHYKRLIKTTVATDTCDLETNKIINGANDNNVSEFFKCKEQESKDNQVNNNFNTVLKFSNQNNKNYSSENLTSVAYSVCEKVDDKENYTNDENMKDIAFDSSSTSDDSDIDIITSCNLSKTRRLAKKLNIRLKQIKTKDGVLFKCTICDKTFLRKYLLTLHLGTHIESDEIKCMKCSKHFKTVDLLFSHVQSIHTKEGDKIDSDGTHDLEVTKENGILDKKVKVTKIYHCALCSNDNGSTTQFDSYKALYLHKKIKHGIGKTKGCETNIEKKFRIKQEFICLICGKQFKSSKALKDHSPVHTGEKNYRCDICNKSYTTSANLKIHKRTHTGTRNFVCSVCNKAFHKKDSLKVHLRKHSGERPFQCDLCPMRFDRNYILKNHRYTHFSEKTFICPFCGKTFTTHGGLNNHEKSHKKDPFAKKPRKPAVKPTLETENAVICDVCGKIYSTKSNLRIHKIVHLGIKPFECSVCHQSYAKKDSMLTHMRKHYDDRPFTCETCGMKFYRNHTLKTHLLRHTGERPHKCKICGKAFTQSSSLTYHVKNHDRKIERKKASGTDSAKPKKKRMTQDGGKPGASPVKRTAKSGAPKTAITLGFEEVKQSEGEKIGSCETPTVLKTPLMLSLPEKEVVKTEHFVLPVPDKEILILDKNLTVELTRNINTGKAIDFVTVEKDGPYNSQPSFGKFNYYIAKSHVFLPKESVRAQVKMDESVVPPKSSPRTDSKCVVTMGGDQSRSKTVKDEFGDLSDDRLDLKPQTVPLPLTGEILNATFISDENGDVMPFSSMTLHGVNADNVMISPVITLEGDERKGGLKPPKFTVVDSKIMYNLPGARAPQEKAPGKGGCHVINLKDARIPQKIHIELDSSGLQYQTPIEDGTLQAIPGFYNTIQQNEL